jgi:hypothetical protein
MSLARKSATASAGRWTIGSPRRLKLVEDHRHAGAGGEPADQPVVGGVVGGADRLQPGGAVDVGDRRDLVAAVSPYRLDQQHERVGVVAFEELGVGLVQPPAAAGCSSPSRAPPAGQAQVAAVGPLAQRERRAALSPPAGPDGEGNVLVELGDGRFGSTRGPYRSTGPGGRVQGRACRGRREPGPWSCPRRRKPRYQVSAE